MSNWSAIDWAIIVVYVIFSGVIGVICRRYVHSMSDFIVAGRRLNTGLAVATFSGTEMGLVTVMYFAEQGYQHGLSAFTLGIISSAAMVIIGGTGFIVRRLRESGVMTIAELYEMRYSRGVRILGGFIIAVAGILNMGAFLRVGAEFLQTVTGMPETATLFGAQVPVLNIVMTALLGVVLLYTLLGGMISVVFTDYFQFILIAFALGLGTLCVLKEMPFSEIVSESVKYRGAASLSPIRSYGWLFIIWNVFLMGSASVLWQAGTMRISASKSPEIAQRVFLITGLTNAARAILPMLFGVAALAYFGLTYDQPRKNGDRPDVRSVPIFSAEAPQTANADSSGSATSHESADEEPKGPEEIKQTQFAMPSLMARIVPTFWLGLLVAGMLAAFMSTHDSYLLAWSSVITQDVVAPLRGGLSTKARVALTRVIIVLLGIFLLYWGLWFPPKGSIWGYLAMTGTIYLSGALSVVVGSLYWKRANAFGATIALVLGAIPGLYFIFAQNFPSIQRAMGIELSEGQIGFASYLLAAAGMIAGSLLTQRRSPPRPIDLMKPVEPEDE